MRAKGADAAPVDPRRLAGVLRPRAEASPLPREAYLDPAVLDWEVEHLFEDAWACAGREEDAPDPGDLFTAQAGRESLLFARAEDAALRGFFNVCQHRGTRMVAEDRRHAGAAPLICPYHAWTYDLDGALKAAQHMREATGFRREEFGLTPVPTATLGGWVFANVSGRAGPFEDQVGNLPERISRFRCEALRRVERAEYEVGANWKVLSENFQECYHCPSIHPELVRVTPYESGGRDELARGSWLGGPMDLREGCTTMSVSGVTDRPPIPGLAPSDRRQVFYYTLLPNLWISLHPDYVLAHTLRPLAVDRTQVVCEWLFHPDAIATPGFDPGDATEFWDLVNRQDFAACERVQAGLSSRGFRGGRFSDMEETIHRLSVMLARSYLEGRLARTSVISNASPTTSAPAAQ